MDMEMDGYRNGWIWKRMDMEMDGYGNGWADAEKAMQ